MSISLAFISFVSPTPSIISNFASSDSVVAASANEVVDSVAMIEKEASEADRLYQNLNLSAAGLSKSALEYALKGYQKLVDKGIVAKDQFLTIVDFSQSSRKKRFYLLDMANQKLLVNTFVSHGKNSGLDMATKFSNTPNSEQSSLGFYVTAGTYTGKHGTSLRLAGQEAGFNSNALARGIVMHGAAYVNAGRVNSGYMGRSQGCPALSEKDYEKVIGIIKNGSVMFVYHPTASYLQGSKLINS